MSKGASGRRQGWRSHRGLVLEGLTGHKEDFDLFSERWRLGRVVSRGVLRVGLTWVVTGSSGCYESRQGGLGAEAVRRPLQELKPTMVVVAAVDRNRRGCILDKF